MTSDRDKSTGRRSRLPSARGEGAPPPVTEGRPTPVRVSLETKASGPTPSVEPDLELARFEVDGQSWVARVLGRGRVGQAPAVATVLLLGFNEGEDPAPPSRESLVAARALSALTPLELEDCLRESSPLRDPSDRKELFPETSSKRRRGPS
ncbi:MAG: hypothetical protein P8170_11025 [Gemmatimonadota bacterium]|jgi:hypothetical protein